MRDIKDRLSVSLVILYAISSETALFGQEIYIETSEVFEAPTIRIVQGIAFEELELTFGG